MTVAAKITSKGQITLPKKVRDLLQVKEGGVVVFEQEDEKIVIKSADSLLDYQGYLKGRVKAAGADAARETAREYRGKKAGKRGRS